MWIIENNWKFLRKKESGTTYEILIGTNYKFIVEISDDNSRRQREGI